jgi:hypothetical protein
MREDLVAPCGMNCNVCSGYLSHSKNLPKKAGPHCIGCRPRNKKCAYLKGHCSKLRNNEINFCYKCKDFPCDRLQTLDKRYRKNYHTSFIENLKRIRDVGVNRFLNEQKEKHTCLKCGGIICIHNGKCYDCEKIESWRG